MSLFGSQYKKHDILIIDYVEQNGDLCFTNGDKIPAAAQMTNRYN